jgi:hypothetical protein
MLYGSDESRQRVAEALIGGIMDTDASRSLEVVDNLWAIHCGDRIPRADAFGEIAPAFAELSRISRFQGDAVHWLTAHCAQWPWHAKETYAGGFRVRTKNPILVATNSRDAHTPLRSALNVSAGFEGSGLLEVNGTGVSDHVHLLVSAP